MPRFPPKEKRFTVDCRVRGSSKAYKKRRLGTVKNISHIGDGPKRRRRIEVEWDDMSTEVVLSNAIEIIGEGEEQELEQSDVHLGQLRLPVDSDSENGHHAIHMPMVAAIDDPNYQVFTAEMIQANHHAIAAQNHHAALATQHLLQKYHTLGKLSELGNFDYVSTSKRTRRRCVSCGKNASYYCMKCSNLGEGIVVPVHNADYKEGCLFDHIEKCS